MRTALLLLLLGSAAPAVAQDSDPRPDRRAEREAAREARSERPQRAERSAQRSSEDRTPRAEAPRRGPSGDSDGEAEVARVRPTPVQRWRERGPDDSERGERPANGFVRRLERDRDERPAESVADVERPAPGPRIIDAPGTRRRNGDTVADWRLRDRGGGQTPELVENRSDSATPEALRDRRRDLIERFARRGDGDGRAPPAVSRVPREGTQPPITTAHRRDGDSHRRWRGDWRRDNRYDWYDWRRRNRARFHLGFYFDPFGWSYRRYSIGWRLWPHYYRSSYWLSDPWSYRLPYAPHPYRWIRYYDDALLVDTYTGEVVDVIHNFFW